MIQMRPGVAADLSQQRALWALSFGDSDAYMDNFYTCCPDPGRVLVLLEDGVLLAMTAWFPTVFAAGKDERWQTAYLYAVCTHPDARGRGLAGALLRYCDFYLKEERGIQALTTVPAQPSLHNFFAANGFRECFVLGEELLLPAQLPAPSGGQLTPQSADAYGALREKLLAGTPHIVYPPDSLAVQAGACRLSGGGLYRMDTPEGQACLCVERGPEGLAVVKELLGTESARCAALSLLSEAAPAERYLVRQPRGRHPFAMLKWLWPGLAERWNWDSTAYLGLAFD